MEVLVPSFIFMISKVGVVFGCKISLIFFDYNSWKAKKMKLRYQYYYFG